MSKKICLLVHGPFSGNAYSEIFSSLKNSREKNIFDKIVFSVYKDDEEMTKEALLPLMSQTNTNCEIVCSEDVFNLVFLILIGRLTWSLKVWKISRTIVRLLN